MDETTVTAEILLVSPVFLNVIVRLASEAPGDPSVAFGMPARIVAESHEKEESEPESESTPEVCESPVNPNSAHVYAVAL